MGRERKLLCSASVLCCCCFFKIIKQFSNVDWSLPCLLKLAHWFPTLPYPQFLLHNLRHTTITSLKIMPLTHVCASTPSPTACQLSLKSLQPSCITCPSYKCFWMSILWHMQNRNVKMTQSIASRNSQSDAGRSQENKLVQYRAEECLEQHARRGHQFGDQEKTDDI